MKTVVLIISNLFLITAAPVDQHHDIEARSVSEEQGLQALITQMRATLANVNQPSIASPAPNPAGVQPQTAYILNPLSPVAAGTPAGPNPAQQSSVPQINLFISGHPQQDRPTVALLPKQTPLQQLVLANPAPMPAIQSPAQVMGLPASYSSVLPQNAVVMPVNVPSQPQAYPHMIGPLQNYAFLNPQANPYFQPLNPLLGPKRFGSYPWYPQIYPPNPYFNYGMPSTVISPPIIFRERGQTVTTQG